MNAWKAAGMRRGVPLIGKLFVALLVGPGGRRAEAEGTPLRTLADVRAWNRALSTREIAAVADPLAAWWTLDGHTGDATWFGRDATQTAGGVSWPSGRAAMFDGTGSMETSGPIVRTDRSYSVAVWARLDAKGDYRVVVSQAGGHVGAFYLEYHLDSDRWAMVVPATDVTEPVWKMVTSRTAPSLGAWTHLVGVYDAGARELRLYVNGVRQSVLGGVASWAANGNLHIGRGPAGGWFAGAVDDMRIYPRTLSDAEVSGLAS